MVMTVDEMIEKNVMKKKIRDLEAEVERLKKELQDSQNEVFRRVDRQKRRVEWLCNKFNFNKCVNVLITLSFSFLLIGLENFLKEYI